MTALLHIAEERVGDATLLRLSGRLELDAGDLALRDHINRLVEEGRTRLVLDMKDVTRIDSAGIGMLVGKYLSVTRKGGTIRLLHLTTRATRLMDITRLVTVFETYDDEAAAIQSLTAGG